MRSSTNELPMPRLLPTIANITTLLALAMPISAQEAVAPHPWQSALQWLDAEVERFSGSLRSAQTTLRGRAEAAQRPDLTLRLQKQPPAPRPRGYGVIPPLLPDLPIEAKPLRNRRYSLEEVTTGFARDVRDAALLALRAETTADLGVATGEYERLQQRLDFLQAQVSYHRHWQRAVPEHRPWFEFQNRKGMRVANLAKLLADPTQREAAQQAQRQVREEIAPFVPTAGLRCQPGTDGRPQLKVVVITDLRDETMLAMFRGAVEREWIAVAREHGLDLRLELRPMRNDEWVSPPPPAGEVVDVTAHLKRFPADALVLTTGAASMHAMVGRAIVLGGDPVRLRELAHEFGHLLGFQDAYLRTFEGQPTDPFGVVLVEWEGILPDLMGASSTGAVSAEMVARLLAAYS
jgi:hypothetical protein